MTAAPPVRILSLTWAEDRYTNAQQVNAREIAARLDPTHFEITLLSDGSTPCAIARCPAIRIIRLPERGRARRILGHLLHGGFDVLFYSGAGLPEAVYTRLPRWWPSRHRSRIVLPVEGDVSQLDEVPAWMRRRMDRQYRRADALVPITDFVAETVARRYGRAGDVVPVGVDLAVFSPRLTTRRFGPPRVLCVGTVKAWKRPELARLAAERFPTAEFTWIGDGDLRAHEASVAPSNLTFARPLGREALPDAYRDADVLLHPSRMEGLPKVILEALASGLPVVAFDDYRPRFLTEGGAGLVVRSPEEMLTGLDRLLGEDGLRDRMGRAARELARRFSWDVVAGRWAEIFEREAALARGR